MITPAQREQLLECLYQTASLTTLISVFFARVHGQIADTSAGVAEMAAAAGGQAVDLTQRWSQVIATVETAPRGE